MFEFLSDAIGNLWSSNPPPAPATAAAQPMPAPAFLQPEKAALPPEAGNQAEPPEQSTEKKPEKKKLSQDELRDISTQIFDAVDGMTEDEDAVLGALRGRSAEEVAAIREQYFKQTGHDLGKDVIGAMDSDEQNAEAMAYLSGDRVGGAVAAMKEATTGIGTNDKKIEEAIKGLSKEELEELKKQMGGEEKLQALIADEQSGNDAALTKALLASDKEAEASVRLDEAMNGGILTSVADYAAESLGVDKATMREAADWAAIGGVVLTGGLGLVAGAALPVLGLMADKADNPEAVEKALESVTDPAKRERMKELYEKQTGQKLDEALAEHFKGPEKEVVDNLMSGDKVGAEAARMRVAADKWSGVDKDKLWKTLEGKSEKERRAIIERFESDAGQHGAFDQMLQDELGADGLDYDKAKMLQKDGKVTDELALEYAMKGANLWGVGTKEEDMKKVLEGKSKEEIAKLSTAYEERTGRKLAEDIDGEVSGRDGFQIGQMMKGEPRTPEEMIARARERYDFERGEGGESLLGKAAMVVLSPALAPVMLAAGVGPSDISNAITDVFSDSGHILDNRQAELEKMYADLQQDPSKAKELEESFKNQGANTDSYGAAKDEVTDTAATTAAIVAGGVTAIATAGTASPAVVAALSAMMGGAAKIGTKAVMQGQAYANEDLGVDVLQTAVEAATGGLLAGAGQAGQAAQAVGKMTLAETLLKGGGGVMVKRGLTNGAIAGLVNGATGALLDENSYSGDVGDLLGAVAKGGLTSAAAGGLGGMANAGVLGAIGDVSKSSMPLLAGTMKGVLGGAASGLVSTAVNPGLYGDGMNPLEALAAGAARGGLGGAFDGFGDARQDALHAAHQGGGAGQGDDVEPATVRRPDAVVDDVEPVTQKSPQWDGPIGERQAPPVELEGFAQMNPTTERSPVLGDPAPAAPAAATHAADVDPTAAAHAAHADVEAQLGHYGATADNGFEERALTPLEKKLLAERFGFDFGDDPDVAPAATQRSPGNEAPAATHDDVDPVTMRSAIDPADQGPDPARMAAYRLQLSPEAQGAVLEGAPGMGRIGQVVPDGAPVGPGQISAAEAQYRIGLVEEMAQSEVGRRMLDVVGRKDIEITLNSGEGHEYAGQRINLDPSMAQTPATAAGLGVHEAYHAATMDHQVNINGQGRDEFVNAKLGNEGQAQAMLFEHYRQIGDQGGAAEHFGNQQYNASYEAAKAAAIAGGADPTAAHAAGMQAGMATMQQAFAAQVPGAFAEQAPDGSWRPRAGGPQNYDEAYKQQWDQNHAARMADPAYAAWYNAKADHEARVAAWHAEQAAARSGAAPETTRSFGPAPDAENVPTVKKTVADVSDDPDATMKKDYGNERDRFARPGEGRDDVPMYAQKGPTLQELYDRSEGLGEGPAADARRAEIQNQIAQKFKNPDFLLANGLISPEQYADPNYLPNLFKSAENPEPIAQPMTPVHEIGTELDLPAAGGARAADLEAKLGTTEEGRMILETMRDKNARLSTDEGAGSFRKGNEINVDPTGRNTDEQAGMAIHEGHHLRTFDEEVDIKGSKRDVFVRDAMFNEAEAQAAMFEHHRESGDPEAGKRELGYAEYHAAYDDAYNRLAAASPDLDPEYIAAIARVNATEALVDKIAEVRPSTSTTDDAPRDYNEHYGRAYDQHHGVGTELDLDGPMNPAPVRAGERSTEDMMSDAEKRAKMTALRIRAMREVTPEALNAAMAKSPYDTQQSKIYLQGVREKWIQLMMDGTVPAGNVSGNFLVDGHHRHMAALIAGMRMKMTQVPMPEALKAFDGLTTHPIADLLEIIRFAQQNQK